MERLDVVTADGVPTGQVVDREQAHAQGIWHRTAHVWIVRKYWGAWQALLQMRSKTKEAYPGCYDCSSAGHVPAGADYLTSALRELQEELGYAASPEQLLLCGYRRVEFRGEFGGKPFYDREFSPVYLLLLNREAEQFTLQPGEVDGVRWFDWQELRRGVAARTIPHCIYEDELDLVQSSLGALARQPERIDLYDARMRPTGRVKLRTEQLEPGEYRRIAFALIFNAKGQMLLTLRSGEKDSYPNVWGNTGGAVQAGEDAPRAIVREVWEETGIRAAQSDFVWLQTDCSAAGHSFTDVYFLLWDVPLSQLTMQPGETTAAKWVTIAEAEAMMAAGQVAKPDADRWPRVKEQVLALLRANI